MPARRRRWDRSSTIQPIDDVRSRAGHGNGPLYDVVSTGVPSLCVPQVEYRVSGPDQPRSRKPLYPHVRHLDHGLVRPEPQEGRFESELDFTSLLYQQGTFDFILTRNRCIRGVKTKVTNMKLSHPTDRALPLLPPKRNLLHRTIPPLLFISTTLTIPPRRE